MDKEYILAELRLMGSNLQVLIGRVNAMSGPDVLEDEIAYLKSRVTELEDALDAINGTITGAR